LAIALLQVIRDAGLPQPAGAVLVSPWCDLYHSFPSIFLNTDTDIVPATGLTMFKPSQIWPPPPSDVGSGIHGVINPKPLSEAKAPAITADQPDIRPRFELEPATSAASGEIDQTIRMTGDGGNPFEITRQIQLYTTNALLKHPLVSPVFAYLGGLPPLFVIASDREVLRDEIIYTAHRAANPAKYPVREEVKKLYPALAGVEGRMEPTAVHLQVYDGTHLNQPSHSLVMPQLVVDTAHVLPLVFMTTTPAKYCYRAIATFIRHVTNMPPTAKLQRHKQPRASTITPEEAVTSPNVSSPPGGYGLAASLQAKERSPWRSKCISRLTSPFRRTDSSKSLKTHSDFSNARNDDAIEDILLAGDPTVYHGGWVSQICRHHPPLLPKEYLTRLTVQAKSPGHQHQGMIRERVSISGMIRPLEPEHDLPALQISPELLGTVSERWVQRYVAGTEHHEKKYAKRIKHLAERHERAIANLQHVHGSQEDSAVPRRWRMKTMTRKRKGKRTSSLPWPLEADDERPPPSSLVARGVISFETLDLASLPSPHVLAAVDTDAVLREKVVIE
jgi:hypothetical protein